MAWVTHIGARRATTASCPAASAMLRAVLPVTQPPHSNPTTRVSTTTTTQDQNIAVLVGRRSLHRSARVRFRGIVSIVFLLPDGRDFG